MKALIKVGYGCNNHCSFCHTLEVRDIEDTTDGVHQKIERAAQLGYSMAVLSGGEPTMRKELMRWAKHASLRGMGFGLVTNGRMLSYPKLVDGLMERGLQYVYMSLHGGTPKIHNAMVRADAFEDTLGALRVLSGRGLDLTVNAVVTTVNVEHLRPIVDLLLPFEDVVLKFSMVQPKGAANRLFNMMVPKVARVAERVKDAIAYGQSCSGGLRFAHDGIPLCLLPGYEPLYDDLKTHGFASMTEVYEPDFYPVDSGDVLHTAKCEGCALKGPCVGLFKAYEESFGDDELIPVQGLRSNSFNYVSERVIPWEPGGACPIFETGLTPYDRARHLFIRQSDSLGIYRTHTRDFSDKELLDVKSDTGQLYFDLSEKNAPDDFASDLRKLSVAESCRTCSAQSRCANAYVVDEHDVFSEDDERVRTIIETLEGDVLDIGCGESRYGDVLREKVKTGEIQYLGVEPDRDAASSFRESHPWAEVRNCSFETLELDGRIFDHILVLRSYNHLRDPSDVIERMTQHLRPGGTLLLVDNVVYGLVRNRAQAEKGESGPSVFEHYRNDSEREAASVVSKSGLCLMTQSPIVPGGSNQWFLHYSKPLTEDLAVS